MRPAVFASLLILALLAVGIRAQWQPATAAKAEVKAEKTEKADEPKDGDQPAKKETKRPRRVAADERTARVSKLEPNDQGLPTWRVEGTLKATREEAYQSALQEATLAVRDYLKRQNPPVQWPVTEAFVAERLVEGPPEEQYEELVILDDTEVLTRSTLKLVLRDDDRRELLAKDQEYRMQQRMFPLAKLLGALVILLGAVAGYVHLDDRTKGYFTGWLALGVLGVILVTAAVLLLV